MFVDATSATSDYVVVGRFGASYGVKGWLKVQSFTEDPQALFDYSPWLIQQQGQWQAVEIEDWKSHSNGWVAKIANINTPEQAQLFANVEIAVAINDLPKLSADEFYWRDLLGCAVVNTKGYHFGVVEQILETGANDVLVVRANSNDAFGQTERLIPFVEAHYVLAVDLTNKQIKVDWDPAF